MDRRALVLGGGGLTGIAWETGLIAGLAGLGIDLAAADVIIGTSAGSVAGTDIARGQELEALYQAQLAPPAPEPAARIGWDFTGRLLWDVHTSRIWQLEMAESKAAVYRNIRYRRYVAGIIRT